MAENGAISIVKRKKFAVVFGTRPEAIKLAPVIRELHAREQDVMKVSTGQHQSMLRQALEHFGITVDHDLSTMRPAQALPELLSRIIDAATALLRKTSPEVVIVQGDTATALGTGLAAYYSHIPVAHVEAGLRTYDDENPFPEEANRSILARLSRWHFCPTEGARDNLLREGIDGSTIYVTGNTVVDALHWGRAKAQSQWNGSLRDRLAETLKIPKEAVGRFLLVTSHRRENFGQPLADVCTAICELVRRREDVRIVWPIHLNPQVRSEVTRRIRRCGPRLIRAQPLSYDTMLALLEGCTFILTDSGGIQEEAAVFQKPVLILRKATERPELLESGGGMLVGTAPDAILGAANRLLDDPSLYQAMSSARNPFGDGHAAERIVSTLMQ